MQIEATKKMKNCCIELRCNNSQFPWIHQQNLRPIRQDETETENLLKKELFTSSAPKITSKCVKICRSHRKIAVFVCLFWWNLKAESYSVKNAQQSNLFWLRKPLKRKQKFGKKEKKNVYKHIKIQFELKPKEN
jgi:hypothetical protein